MYHDYKRCQGITEDVIEQKKGAIVGVLEAMPAKWYFGLLEQAGFVDIEILHSNVGFVTWMARKPAGARPCQAPCPCNMLNQCPHHVCLASRPSLRC